MSIEHDMNKEQELKKGKCQDKVNGVALVFDELNNNGDVYAKGCLDGITLDSPDNIITEQGGRE